MVATLKSSFLSNVGTSFKRKSMYARTRDKANKLVANVADESGTSREPAGFDLSQRRKKGKTPIRSLTRLVRGAERSRSAGVALRDRSRTAKRVTKKRVRLT